MGTDEKGVAEAHLMEHWYLGFDEPLDLRPPI